MSPSESASSRFPLRLVVGIVVGAIVLGCGGASLGGWWFLKAFVWRQQKYRVSLDEAQYSLTAEEALRGVAGADPAGEQAAAVAAIESLVAAHSPASAGAFVDQLHLPRMLAQAEANGTLADLNTQKKERDFLTGMRKGMTTSIARATAVPTLRWVKVRVARISFRREPLEAVAFCFIRTEAQLRIKLRFWSFKEGGRWRIYDWESLNDGQRVSTMVGATMAHVGSLKGATAKAGQLQQAPRHAVRAVECNAEGRFEEARAEVAKADALKPPAMAAAQLRLVDAVALHGLGRHEEALASLAEATRRQPNLPVAHYVAAEVHRSAGHPEECLKSLERYLDVLGPDPDAFLLMGTVHEEMGRTDQAAKAYEQGVAADPEDWDNRHSLARIRLAAGDPAAALELFRDSVRHAPEPTEWFAGGFDALADAGAWGEAAELAADFARMHPDDPEGPYRRGTALRAAGRIEDAEPVLRLGLPLEERSADPYPARFWYELGLCLAARGQRDEAIALAEKLRAVPDTESDGLLVRAAARAGVEPEEAAADVEAALKLAPFCLSIVRREATLAALRELPRVKSALEVAERRMGEGQGDEEGADGR